MTDLFMVQNKFDQMISHYKTLRPAINSNNKIKYTFPKGGYIVDNVKLKIKYEGKDVSPTSFKLSNFFSTIASKQLVRSGSGHGRSGGCQSNPNDNIPMEFIDAYNQSICMNQLESHRHFDLPLLRLVSVMYGFGVYAGETFSSTPSFKLYKSPTYQDALVQLYLQMKDKNASTSDDTEKNINFLKNLILENIITYVESKLEFIIFYRETELLTGTGKSVSPDPITPYVLDKYTIGSVHQSICNFKVSDTGSRLDYNNMVVVFENDKTALKEISLRTNFNPDTRICTNFQKLSNSTWTLSNEQAKMYNLPFQTSDTTYLIDIKQYISTYVKLFIANRIEQLAEATSIFNDYISEKKSDEDNSRPPTVMEANYERCVEHIHESEHICRTQLSKCEMHSAYTDPITKLNINVTLILDRPYTGKITVYLF